MFNWVEVLSISLALVVGTGFLFERRLRAEGRRQMLFLVYLTGIGWACLLIFGQPYVRPPIRVALGLVALAIMIKILLRMARGLTQRA